jgi:hypothetical protein
MMIYTPIGAIDQATITEHLCVTKLKKLGFHASIVHMKETDVILGVGEHLLRIQVKSSRIKRHSAERPNKFGYHFSVANGSKVKTPVTKEQCDILAFVAYERERIFFLHITEHKNKITKRFPKHFFDSDSNLDIEYNSLTEAIKIHFKYNKLLIDDKLKIFLGG